MPWAIIGAAVIQGGASYLSSQNQADAANQGNALNRQIYTQNRADLAPYRAVGTNALNQFAGELGLPQYQPGTGVTGGVGSTDTPGMTAAMNATGTRGGDGADVLQQIATGFLSSRKNNSAIQDISQALANGATITDAQWAQAGYGPGGSDPNAPAAQPGSAPGAQPFQSQFRETPGYQFAYNEGMRGVNNAFAARGLLQSGSRAKGITQYGQGIADQEYNNYLNRLASAAGIGQSATNTSAQLGQNFGQTSANLYGQAANATASGYQGISDAANNALNNYNAYQNRNTNSFPDSVYVTPGYFGGGG